MCAFCDLLGSAGAHWSEAAFAHEFMGQRPAHRPEDLRARMRRLRELNRILAFYGVSAEDFNGVSWILRNRTGSVELVDNFVHLWPVVEQLSKRYCDPLDPELGAKLHDEADDDKASL